MEYSFFFSSLFFFFHIFYTKQDGKKWRIKYYKGLGTSDRTEAKEYFSNLDKNLIPFTTLSDDPTGKVCEENFFVLFFCFFLFFFGDDETIKLFIYTLFIHTIQILHIYIYIYLTYIHIYISELLFSSLFGTSFLLLFLELFFFLFFSFFFFFFSFCLGKC